MTIRRIMLLMVLPAWLCGAGVFGQEPDAPPKTDEAVQQPPAEPSPEEPPVTTEEAIRLAIEAFDRIESEDDVAARQVAADDAQRYTGIVRADDPDNPWLHYLDGTLLALAGRSFDATEELRQFTGTHVGQNYWNAYRRLGDLFVDEFPSLAKSYYRKALALKADDPRVLYGLSLCADKLGKKEDAVKRAQEAAEAERGDPQRKVNYLNHGARMLLKTQRLTEARDAAALALDRAKSVLRNDPNSAAPLSLVEEQYKLLIAISSARAQEDAALAEVYIEIAQYTREMAGIRQKLAIHEAIRVLELGLDRTAPDTPAMLLEEHAALLAEVGRTDEAKQAFEKILESHPNNARATEFLKRHAPKKPDPQSQPKTPAPPKP